MDSGSKNNLLDAGGYIKRVPLRICFNSDIRLGAK